MGLCKGKIRVGVPTPDPTCRRLTVSVVESGECESQADVKECDEDRILLRHLSSQQFLALLADEQAQVASRKFSIGTVTDKALHRVTSFSSKATLTCGDQVEAEDLRFGYACKKGLKPDLPNQDSFQIILVEGVYSIYGVFDGHGRKGHDISNFVKENLTKLLVGRKDILKDPLVALSFAFDTTQRLIEQATSMQRIDAQRSGTTASVVVHDHRSRVLHISHVGDSRCVLAKKDISVSKDENQWSAVELTIDHKPNLPAEMARIERKGGQVIFDGGYNYRVYAKGKRYPGLNMSRAMGDLRGFHDAGISAEPDLAQWMITDEPELSPSMTFLNIPRPQLASEASNRTPGTPDAAKGDSKSAMSQSEVEHELQSVVSMGSKSSCAASVSSHAIDPINDKFLLMCSDGVWEFLSSIEAVLTAAPFQEHQATDAAEYLASAAWDRWMQFMQGEVVDDITVLLVHLGEPPKRITDPAKSETVEVGKS